MTRFLTGAAVAVMATAPALGQEVASPLETGGTISGTLDLEPAVWSVASVDGELASSWAPTSTARLVRLVGIARQSGESGLTDSLIITFRAAGNPAEPDVQDPLVAYFPAGSDRTWMAEGENVDLSVEALEVSGESMAVAGSFVALMTPGGTEGLVEEDADLVTVDGNFQATLGLDAEMSFPAVPAE